MSSLIRHWAVKAYNRSPAQITSYKISRKNLQCRYCLIVYVFLVINQLQLNTELEHIVSSLSPLDVFRVFNVFVLKVWDPACS